MTPRARAGMLSEQVGDEVIVYDKERARAHRLNRTAGLVWQHANGARTVPDLVAVLQQELDPIADENLVMCTLDNLSAARLLEESAPRPIDQARTARRQLYARSDSWAR